MTERFSHTRHFTIKATCFSSHSITIYLSEHSRLGGPDSQANQTDCIKVTKPKFEINCRNLTSRKSKQNKKMSQQKSMIVIAICVLGLVVVASAQNFDGSACQSKGREAMDQFVSSMSSSLSKFTNSLQSTAQGSADLSPFQQQMDQIQSSVNSMMSQGQSFSVDQAAQSYTQVLSSSAQMMSTAFRMSLKFPQNMMSSYMELGQSMMSAQSQLITTMSNACTPQRMQSLP